jgi:prophage antirepressor-like protein
MSNLLCIGGVRGYEKNGVAYLHIEDVARGLGFTTKVNETEYVRWPRVDEYLGNFGFLPQVANEENPHDYYIPENIFYRLCMKAKNEVAEAFQIRVADEIIPSIRRTGSYSIQPTQPALPNFTDPAEAVIAWANEYRAKQAALAQRDEAIRTKAHFVEGRDAEMCGRNGGLTKSNNLLRNKNSALQTQIDTLKEGWWSVSDMARAVRNSGALLRDYSDNALKDKCRYGLRHYATHLGKPSRMLNIDSTHTLSDGSVVQNKAEFFDEEVANMFLQWVKANPEKFPSIMTTLCFIDDDRDE